MIFANKKCIGKDTSVRQ